MAKTAVKKKHTIRNIILIVLAVLVAGAVIYKLIAGYVATLPKFSYTYGSDTLENLAAYPDTSFAVISDTHIYDASLGTTGSAFEECMNSDRKLLIQSTELLSLCVDKIKDSGVKFVLVSGDLTKDGELINHEIVANELQRLVDSGIKVFVVPGNHDVNNPLSVKYDGETTELVPNVSASDFPEIYKNLGYGDAILRDPSSLSYVAEPQDGLWVVAMDSCESENNQPGVEEIWAGELTQSQIDWLQGVLQQAQDEGKAVILLEHHGIVEHWDGQRTLHPDYLLSDYSYAGKFLSSYGVRVAFSGHYHAQDITLEDNGSSGFIYDIETGSMITPPCPLRICSISNNNLTIQTETLIDSFDSAFIEKSWAFVKKTLHDEAYKTLKKYHVKDSDAEYISNGIADAFVAHYNGDEETAARVVIDTSKLNLWSRIIYSQYSYAVDGLSKDLLPGDNNCTLDLSKAP